jgi:alkylation response protein AidB-like acyl-CoA dehydrogenase
MTGGSAVYQWTDEQEMVRSAARHFIDKEIRPRVDELEHGDTPPYDVLRKMYKDLRHGRRQP